VSSNQPNQPKQTATKAPAQNRQDPKLLDRAADLELKQRDADFDKEIDLHKG